MNIYKHYSNGITHITDSGQYTGYEPTRTEAILSVHIHTDTYTVDVYPHGITIKYKYIKVTLWTFSIGRWNYSIDALQGYRGSERKRVLHMYSTLTQLIREHSIDSQAIQDWGVLLVLASHAVDLPDSDQ